MLKIKIAPVSLYKIHFPFRAWSINTGNILQRTTTIKCIIHLKHFEALYQFDAGKNILYKMMKYGALEGAFYRRQSIFSIKRVPNEHFIENFLPSIKNDREPEVFQMDNAFYRGGSLQNNTSIYSPCSERKMYFIEGNRGSSLGFVWMRHFIEALLSPTQMYHQATISPVISSMCTINSAQVRHLLHH